MNATDQPPRRSPSTLVWLTKAQVEDAIAGADVDLSTGDLIELVASLCKRWGIDR